MSMLKSVLADSQVLIITFLLSAFSSVILLRFIAPFILSLFTKSSSKIKFIYETMRRHYFPSLYLFLGLFIFDIMAFALDIETNEAMFNSVVMLSFTWVLAKSIKIISSVIYQRFNYLHKDNIRERKIHTQALFVEKILVVAVWCLGMLFTALSLEEIRGMGTQLLASAGVLSVVLGFAAQKGLANLIAGFQIAFTQPIRIDDVIIVENEWGRVEEITLTYVVVKLWDWRRMILPVTYFTQNSFQNWTRSHSDLLASVRLWVDYQTDVEKLRDELAKILSESKLYNGHFWNLQVVDSTPQAIELRVLVTANDSSEAWDLRCEVREKLIRSLQERQPHAFAYLRVKGVELESSDRAKSRADTETKNS